MLLDILKSKAEEARIKTEWQNWQFKNGHKAININNFLELNYTHCAYIVNGVHREGFYTKDEINFIFDVLDYHEGRIQSMAG